MNSLEVYKVDMSVGARYLEVLKISAERSSRSGSLPCTGCFNLPSLVTFIADSEMPHTGEMNLKQASVHFFF